MKLELRQPRVVADDDHDSYRVVPNPVLGDERPN
jgi:hypothetical protein